MLSRRMANSNKPPVVSNMFNPLLFTQVRPYWTTVASSASISNGSRTLTSTGGYRVSTGFTSIYSSGKIFCNIRVDGASFAPMVGFQWNGSGVGSYPGGMLYSYGYYGYSPGWVYPYDTITSSAFAYGTTYTTGDVIGIAIDFDTTQYWFLKNSVVLNGGIAAGVFQNQGNIAFSAGMGSSAAGTYKWTIL
jgi:hypothetical protein